MQIEDTICGRPYATLWLVDIGLEEKPGGILENYIQVI